MHTHIDKSQDHKSKSVVPTVAQKKEQHSGTFQFVDNRSDTMQLQRLQEMANNSTHNKHAVQLKATVSNSTTIQKQALEEEEPLQGKFETMQKQGLEEEELVQGKFETIQQQALEEEEPLQGKFKTIQKQGLEEEELVQGKFETIQRQALEEEEPLQGKFKTIQRVAETESPSRTLSIQKKENNTGLPDTLKSGIENLSGYAMDDVKVHYNSDKPSQLQAHAYAQGTDIHLASGQEKHLPHEAWHVVQQKQGRVQPTMQMKGKININDDAGLEKEADVMGEKALQMKEVSTISNALITPFIGNNPLQLKSHKLKGLAEGDKVDLRTKIVNEKAPDHNTVGGGSLVNDHLKRDDEVDIKEGDVFTSRTSGNKDNPRVKKPQYKWIRLNSFHKNEVSDKGIIDVTSQQYYVDHEEVGDEIEALKAGKPIFKDKEVGGWDKTLDKPTAENKTLFDEMWGMTNTKDSGEFIFESRVTGKADANVLIISEEAEVGKRNTGAPYEKDGAKVDRTFYPTPDTDEKIETAAHEKYFGKEGRSHSYNSRTDTIPENKEKRGYDIIIGRSAICFCWGDRMTCGGYGKHEEEDTTADTIANICDGLAVGGKAYLTVGTLRTTGGGFYVSDRMVDSAAIGKAFPKQAEKLRTDAIKVTHMYWHHMKDSIEKVAESKDCTLTFVYMEGEKTGSIPKKGPHAAWEGSELEGSFYGILIKKNK
ncbi:eCIS core domain-containing protein [Aquimarina aggregata]|uniref:eCIS core domain-containing protein n=1 Tax=Aquimarina aggregata TaxID=1642818 RepID=UPI002491DA15|nr:DUF4157 domain-containing protein [Aquimarina aggregata]